MVRIDTVYTNSEETHLQSYFTNLPSPSSSTMNSTNHRYKHKNTPVHSGIGWLGLCIGVLTLMGYFGYNLYISWSQPRSPFKMFEFSNNPIDDTHYYCSHIDSMSSICKSHINIFYTIQKKDFKEYQTEKLQAFMMEQEKTFRKKQMQQQRQFNWYQYENKAYLKKMMKQNTMCPVFKYSHFYNH